MKRKSDYPRLETAEFVCSLCVLSAFSILTLLRCFYGVDPKDEAQYVGQAYMTLIGGAPFRTDLFIQQIASILLTPLLWIFISITGNSEGIVLVFRLLWWLAATTVAGVIFARLCKRVSALGAALTSSLIVCFIPFMIPSPSYNSLGVLLLTLGLCEARFLSISQICFLFLAGVVYPPFGSTLVVLLLI